MIINLITLAQAITTFLTGFGVIALFFSRTKKFLFGDLYTEIKEIKEDIDLIKNNHLAHIYEEIKTIYGEIKEINLKLIKIDENFNEKLTNLNDSFNTKLTNMSDNFNTKFVEMNDNFNEKLLKMGEDNNKRFTGLETQQSRIEGQQEIIIKLFTERK